MSLCRNCTHGHHPHDRWTSKAPGNREPGTDAGCPYITTDGQPCTCTHTVPPTQTQESRAFGKGWQIGYQAGWHDGHHAALNPEEQP